MKILTIALAVFLCSLPCCAQNLSEQNLIDLKKAGVDKAIMVQQIEKDGINFPMDAATTIRLKNLGFPDEVLSALINIGSKKSSAAAVDPVKTLYAQGKYPELCDYLKLQLGKDPTNYRLRTILIGALLKIDQQPAALAELEKLKNQSQDPSAKSYADRASLLVSSWQKQQEGKKRLLAALQNYSYAEADSAVDQLSASLMQKTILHMLVDSYAGMYQIALARTSQLQNISFADKERIDVVKNKIAESEKNYNLLLDRVNLYLHSPTAIGPCTPDDWKQTPIPEYVDLVSKLSRLGPLSAQVMNLAFHAALLSTKYENLQALGDKILAAQGTIQIPFYSRDRYFYMVIDTKLKRLYTQSDGHKFDVACAVAGVHLIHNADHNDRLSEFVKFDLPFDQIRSISQKAKSNANRGIRLETHSYALSFDPTGVAPNYALMNILLRAAGEEAELQATRNLGQFVLHVIGNPNIKADLADPSKTYHGGDWGDALVAMYGATHANTPLGAMALQVVADDKAQNAMTAQEQQATWQSTLARDYSSLLDGSIFDGLDKLVETQ